MSAASEEGKLKELLKAAIVEVLEERRDLLRAAVEEALEDAALAHAVGEGEDSERVGWSVVSRGMLAGAYAEDEPEYPLDLIKVPNPDYERG